MSDNATLELVSLLTSDEQYKTRLLELQKRTAEAQAAEDKANKAKADAEKFVKIAEQVRQKHHGELEAKKREHDEAAVEAAKRIQLNNEQAKELLALKSHLDEREQDLNDKEAALLKASRDFAARADGLHAREQAVKRAEADHAEKRRKAEAFLNA